MGDVEMVKDGGGVAQRLRNAGRALAQDAVLQLCREAHLGFAVNAATAAEYLAKAVVADHNPRLLFARPGTLSNAAAELLCQQPTAADQLSVEERQLARRELLSRKTISGPQAVRAVVVLGMVEPPDIDDAKRLFEVRSQAIALEEGDGRDAIHLASLDVIEALWVGEERTAAQLWEHLADAVGALRSPDPDGLAWSTAMRIAVARDRHPGPGGSGVALVGSSSGDEEWVVCPVCRSDAVVRQADPSVSTRTDAWTGADSFIVFTCPMCALELFGEPQLRLAGITAPRLLRLAAADPTSGRDAEVSARSLLQRVRRTMGEAPVDTSVRETEQRVSRRLERLGEEWQVMGARERATFGAGVEHLVLGSPGVFQLTTIHHPGSRVWVEGLQILVDGQTTTYLRDARSEADRASTALSRAFGARTTVRPIVLFDGHDGLTVQEMPSDVHVNTLKAVVKWLRGQPELLSQAEINLLSAVARMRTTWSGVI